MEHHLLTCDPIGGLVQIVSNAIRWALCAAELALESDPKYAKVPLDKVVDTMWQTAGHEQQIQGNFRGRTRRSGEHV
jgi:L-serine dehydratase